MNEAAENWTGERMETRIFDNSTIEHLHRYALCFDYVKDKAILDIASGEGYGSNLLSYHAKTVTGVDISSETIKKARQKYKRQNLTFLTGSASKIPLEPGSVDVVISFETLEHHDQHDQMMLEIKRVLKRDGMLIISTPDKLHYTDIPNIKNPFHVKELYVKEFETLLAKYFSNTSFFNQRMIYGSIICSGEFKDFKYFSGDYSNIDAVNKIDPLYVVGFASDSTFVSPPFSMFDGMKALHNIYDTLVKDTSNKYERSKRYMIGNLMLYPFALLKKALR